MQSMARRAVGIVRVSSTKGREGESFHSPATQRKRIVDECERQGLALVEVHQELDVSGGMPLDERPGLRRAVESIETGDADVIVAAYLDRLARSIRVRDEVIERVEAAGGSVLTVDMGLQTNGTASQWLSGTLSSAVGEYLRRATAERSALAQQAAIDRGVAPWPNIPPGYQREVLGRRQNGAAISGRLHPDPDTAATVVEAFRMRADRASVGDIREFLRDNGIARSYHGTAALLASKVYLGQIHFGDYEPNLEAHPALVDRDLWDTVQSISLPRGRKAKSDRLLARQELLRCGTCGARMVVGSSHYGRYPIYRCPPNGDCSRRVTISAELVEELVIDRVRDAIADLEGRASAERAAYEADMRADRAQADLDAAIRSFAGLDGEDAARERIAELRAARDAARTEAAKLGGQSIALTVNIVDAWDTMTIHERRALVRSQVASVTVAPGGRGASRVGVKLLGE